MAFDNSRAGGAAEQLGLGFEQGQIYVAPAAGPPRFLLLDGDRAATLTAWADTLIPGDEHWPAARVSGAAEYADNCAARSALLRRELRVAVDAVDAAAAERGHDGRFAELDDDSRAAVLRDVEESHGEHFTLVLELVFEGYYRDGRIQQIVEQRTGFLPAVPVTGMRLAPFDESLLDEIRERPPAYRKLEEEL